MARFADGSSFQIWAVTELKMVMVYEGASVKMRDYTLKQIKLTPQLYIAEKQQYTAIIGGEVRLAQANGTYDVLHKWGKEQARLQVSSAFQDKMDRLLINHD